jgi:ABC-type multidrug transport system fused ATPase/permease subunit
MKEYLAKIFYIAGNMKGRLPFMLGLNLAALVLELVGLTLIIPFLAVLQNPEKLTKYDIWNRFAEALNIQTHMQALIWLSLVLFAVFLVKTILNIKLQVMIQDFSFELQTYLRSRFSKLFLSASYLFHTKRRSNEILTIMQSHISQFSKAVVASLLRIVGEVITATVVLIYLLMEYPVPTITALVVLISFGVIYDFVLRRRLKKAGEDLIIANNGMLRAIREGILSIKEARVLGAGDYFHEQIHESSLRSSNISAYVALIQLLPRYILELLILGVVMLSALILLMNEGDGTKLIDSLAVFAVAAIRLLPSANQIVSNITNLRYSYKTIDELYGELKELETGPKGRDKNNFVGQSFESLELKNIVFSYPDDAKRVLNEISMSFKKGEIVGIAGASGAGKSTLVNIILGLLEPQSGSIILNGQEVSSALWAGHKFAAYIPQKPVMLDSTVSRNVALGEERIDRDKVLASLRKAQLEDVVARLPNREESLIGEDAAFLSGGQRQRVAVARAFYFDREILVFDEATSALDKDTENEVLQAIRTLSKGAAVLMIAHNEQSLQICDRICYLSEGKIV